MVLGNISIYVENVRATVAFYEAAVGLTCRVIKESGQYAEMETSPGAALLAISDETQMPAGMRRNRSDEPPAGVELAFYRTDVAAAYDTALAAGAVGFVSPHRTEWGQEMATIRDNNGILVKFYTRYPPPAP